MTWQPRKIQVLCPSCNRVYDTRVQPPEPAEATAVSAGCPTRDCSIKCPACHHEISCTVTFVKDGLFQVQCDKRRN